MTSPTKLRRITLALLTVLALVLTACGDDDDDTQQPSDDGGSSGSSAEIVIEDFDFGDPITVSVGDTVTVTNQDGASHTWTSDDEGVFDSGTISSGDSFEHTFDAAGTYGFFCAIHPSMTGTITVS